VKHTQALAEARYRIAHLNEGGDADRIADELTAIRVLTEGQPYGESGHSAFYDAPGEHRRPVEHDEEKPKPPRPNHIHNLTKARDDAHAQLKAAQDDITSFLAFLHGPKFTGTESDGGRKDWISTGDVVRWLMDLRGTLQVS
jgi:hypothetical protein